MPLSLELLRQSWHFRSRHSSPPSLFAKLVFSQVLSEAEL
jgi:hypothetical protein